MRQAFIEGFLKSASPILAEQSYAGDSSDYQKDRQAFLEASEAALKKQTAENEKKRPTTKKKAVSEPDYTTERNPNTIDFTPR